MKKRPVSIGSNLKRVVVSARPVVPSRVSLPVKAGCCEPEAFLCEERRAVLRDLSKVVLDEEYWATPLPRPCHMISASDEVVLRRSLLEREMVVLIKERDVPVDRVGRKLLAGLFCVEHKFDSDRLIVDRRPQNETELRLGWARLPHGSLLGEIFLRPTHGMRDSGLDISSYFYHLAHNPEWKGRTCFGRVFTGADASALGGIPPNDALEGKSTSALLGGIV